jgi:ATP-binding cassette, subfamily B, bacterial
MSSGSAADARSRFGPAAVAVWFAERFRSRREALHSSGRLIAIRMLWACGAGWTALVGASTLLDAALPNVTAIFLGRAVGQIPATAHDGIHSAVGTSMLVSLGVGILLYALSLTLDPVGSALNSVVSQRIYQDQQQRLIAAVSGPVGIAHLEDPQMLDDLEAARGTYMSYSPTTAPLTFASSLGNRVGGLMACAIVGELRWWLGLGLCVAWLAVRPPLRRVVIGQIRAFRGETTVMRRAWYFLTLGTWRRYAKEVRVFDLADWVVQGFRQHWLEGMRSSWRSIGELYRLICVLLVFVLMILGVACLTIAWAAYHHEATLAQLVTVLTLLPATTAVGSISYTDVQLEWMVSALPDMTALESKLLAASAQLPGQLSATGLPRDEINFKQVGFRYPRSSSDVLKDLNFTLPAGQSTALVGANGAGKTTLVKLVCRLHDPTTGRISVDGRALDELDPRSWRRQVAVVLQDFNTYPFSAGDNIFTGAIEHRDDLDGMVRAAERAGAREFIERLPDGFDTTVSRAYTGGVDLSGGQWQRLALARALFAVQHGARLLILDEPTAWLDVRAEAAFFDRFLSLTRGVTSLIISHRFSTVRRADRIAVIDGGLVTESGTHDELIQVGGAYAAMFRAQASPFVKAGEETR